MGGKFDIVLESFDKLIEPVDKLFKRMALPIALLVGAHYLEKSREIGDVLFFYLFLILFSSAYIVLVSVSCYREMSEQRLLERTQNKVIAGAILFLLVLSIFFSSSAVNFGPAIGN